MISRKHTAEFDIPRSVGQVFPLFSPEGEKLWAPDWDYENIMETTELSEDYVFLTSTHDHASVKAVWLVKQYHPEKNFIEYYKVEPEDKVGVVTVQCFSKQPDLTRVQVSYKYIALSESGRDFLNNFTGQYYWKFIGEWKDLLMAHFERVDKKR